MPLLLHLNGPSGVGKSTLARRLADDRPGTLDLDVDQLVPLVGGWSNGFFDAWETARRLAIGMASAHLADGHDVVLPQMVNRIEEVARFEAAASAAGAAYVEVALLAPLETQASRFRAKQRSTPIDRHIGGLLDDTALTRIHGHHAAYLEARPAALRVETDGLDSDATYAELCSVIRSGGYSDRTV